MSDSETLKAEVALGQEFEKWLASDVGQYMVAGFEHDKEEAQTALAKVWPWRKWRIVQLQERIRLANKFESLVAQAIIAGRQAQEDLETPPE